MHIQRQSLKVDPVQGQVASSPGLHLQRRSATSVCAWHSNTSVQPTGGHCIIPLAFPFLLSHKRFLESLLSLAALPCQLSVTSWIFYNMSVYFKTYPLCKWNKMCELLMVSKIPMNSVNLFVVGLIANIKVSVLNFGLRVLIFILILDTLIFTLDTSRGL